MPIGSERVTPSLPIPSLHPSPWPLPSSPSCQGDAVGGRAASCASTPLPKLTLLPPPSPLHQGRRRRRTCCACGAAPRPCASTSTAPSAWMRESTSWRPFWGEGDGSEEGRQGGVCQLCYLLAARAPLGPFWGERGRKVGGWHCQLCHLLAERVPLKAMQHRLLGRGRRRARGLPGVRPPWMK